MLLSLLLTALSPRPEVFRQQARARGEQLRPFTRFLQTPEFLLSMTSSYLVSAFFSSLVSLLVQLYRPGPKSFGSRHAPEANNWETSKEIMREQYDKWSQWAHDELAVRQENY